MHLKMSSAKWRPSCLGLNVLKMFLIVGSLEVWMIFDIKTPYVPVQLFEVQFQIIYF